MSFASDVEAYAKKAGASLDETSRAIVLELFGSVIKDTPVDTGRARGNWQTTIGTPANGQTDRKGEGAALAEVAVFGDDAASVRVAVASRCRASRRTDGCW